MGLPHPLRGPRLVERDGNSNERMRTMNVLVTTDGSKYGRWGLNWAAKLPFVEPPKAMNSLLLELSFSPGNSDRCCRTTQNDNGHEI